MADTGNTELSLSTSKTLNPSDPINGSHPAENAQIHQKSSSPAAQPSDDVVSGEKRKREDSDSGVSDPSLNPLWKTSLCSYFRQHDGSCSHSSECCYAPGEEELRPRPDNTWDPTSERVKKAMKSDTGEKCTVSLGVMMTEAVVDDADGEDNDDSNHALSKCLVHLPRKWGLDNLRGFLNQEGIPFKSAKKKKGMLVGFVTFEDQEQLKSSTKELEGKIICSKRLKVADVIPRSFEKKSNSNVTLCAESAQNADAALAKENTDGNVDSETNGANLAVGDSMP